MARSDNSPGFVLSVPLLILWSKKMARPAEKTVRNSHMIKAIWSYVELRYSFGEKIAQHRNRYNVHKISPIAMPPPGVLKKKL